jgi:hypothetical protein
MNREQALKFKADYIAKGARDFTNPAHYELDPVGFFEPHVEVVIITREDIHELKGGTLSLKKETVDKIARASGVSFRDLPAEKHNRGEPFIGRCQPIIQGPDGQPVTGDVAVYEFDPELRAEEDILKAQEKAEKDGQKYVITPNQRRLKVLDYEKSGHQRANTGARSRATIAAVGMQTGFKDLFRKGPTEYFLFSRVIINVKNKMVAEMQLSAISGNVRNLYGPKQIESSPGDVTAHYEVQEESEPISRDAFTPDAPEPTIEALRMATLQDLLDKYEKKLNPEGVRISREAIAQQHNAHIQDCLEAIKQALAKQNIILGGGV